MKKLAIFGIIAGAAAAVTAVILKKKHCKCEYCEEIDEELDCDDCCCGCDGEPNEIPAEMAEDPGIVTDSCTCGGDEKEGLEQIKKDTEAE